MRRRNSQIVLLAFVVALASTGYFWWDQDDQDSAIDDIGTLLVSKPNASPAQEPPAEEPLELNLQVGDRFPLLKTVEQTVLQPMSQGTATSRSSLELMMAITVEEIRDQHKRLGVQYHRVKFSQNVAGEELNYDSAVARGPVPIDVRAYQGLVNNGFYFWIGEDNQLIELVGFEDFLKRCVRDVPDDQRQFVMTTLLRTSGDEGIANFIDDSIGLLPYSSGEGESRPTVKVGDEWTRERQILRPVPLYLTNKCTLKSFDERIAEIEIVGNIAPSSTYGPIDQISSEMNVQIRGGRTFGNCVIDRASGLPINSRMQRHLEMIVHLANGREIEQHKLIVTTIRAFPEQSSQ